MRILGDSVCKFCRGVFCCANCRQKHEFKSHSITVQMPLENDSSLTKKLFETIYLFCPICEKKPLILRPELHDEMLLHIQLHHLPLRCRKCFKIYHKINDLVEFSKCLHPTIVCQSKNLLNSNESSYTDEVSKVTVTKTAKAHNTILKNSPLSHRQDFNDSHMTPISIINMRWKAKSKLTLEEFISDSVSSIKNISSINNSSARPSTEMTTAAKGKVIRCSSTPVHLEMFFSKPREQAFNASGGGQMSSIQYTSGCESDNSPALSRPNCQPVEKVHRGMKVTGCRPRIPAVTPLRQVMSKSIQKAFAQHAIASSNLLRGSNVFQRKTMFDSTSSNEDSEKQSPQQPPLDLRLSPAVRRYQNENNQFLKNRTSYNQRKKYNKISNLRHEVLLSTQKLTNESIVITRTERLSSVSSSMTADSVQTYPTSTSYSYQSARSNNTHGSLFKSCSSTEIFTTTTEKMEHLEPFDEECIRRTEISSLTPITSIPGATMNKKIIKFDTPKTKLGDTRVSQSSPNEVFFTPNATPNQSGNGNVSIDAKGIKQRRLLVKQNLNGRFSPLRRPSIKEYSRSTDCEYIECMTNNYNNINDDNNDDDNVFLLQEQEKLTERENNINKSKTLQPGGLWSLMSTVMRFPLRKASSLKESYQNEQYPQMESCSIVKRCVSLAGSLVRSKSVNESDLNSLKRKRTYTADSTYLTELSNSEAMPGINTSSKRFRIQGRRPIDRMRLNS